MKHLLFTLLFIGFGVTTQIVAQNSNPFMVYKPNRTSSLDDGRYEATVYYSSSTGQRSTYSLAVLVSNDCVVGINFGNGGSVHSGRNSEGYTYSGGALRVKTNSSGEPISASTTVTVTYSNGTIQRFQIEL